MAGTEEHDDIEPSLLQEKAECLGELAEQLAVVFGATPIVASAIVEHVFQCLIQQFYEKGKCYFPNFGWCVMQEEQVCHAGAGFVMSPAMAETLKRMQKAREADGFSLALIDQLFAEIAH